MKPAALHPLACLLLLASTAAVAGPKEEVKAATDKFMAAKSFHATMTGAGGTPGQGMTSQVDFVAPDRYRMQLPTGTQYLVGDTMYMTIEGRTMKLPMGKGALTQWRDPANLRQNEATLDVTALGTDLLDGKPARKYRMVSSKSPGTESVMWVGGNGYPLQIVVNGKARGKPSTVTIRYSRFNDPTIAVDPPK